MKPQYELKDSVAEDRQVLKILAGFEQLRRLEARREFAAIARRGRDRVFLNAGGMGGELRSQVHAASFHYWGQRLGYQCWNDPQFCREYLRDNEYARVKSRPRNPTVSMAARAPWAPIGTAARAPRPPARRGVNLSGANFNGLKLAN